MYKMRCIRQTNIQHSLFFVFYQKNKFGNLEVLMEMNVYVIQLLTFMYFFMDCTMEFKFGMMIHHNLLNSFT